LNQFRCQSAWSLVAACTLKHCLVSMIELRKHFNTGSSRRLLSRVHVTHWCVCVAYIALNLMLFSLWAVSASSNFFVDLASKQSTQRVSFFIILQQPKHRGVVLLCPHWQLCYKTKTSKLRFSDLTIQRGVSKVMLRAIRPCS
jgi:hypothetical protein